MTLNLLSKLYMKGDYKMDTNVQLETSQNLSIMDRAARIALGVGLFAMAFADLAHGAHMGWPHIMAISIGLYPNLTGMFGWDPVYQVTHVDTAHT